MTSSKSQQEKNPIQDKTSFRMKSEINISQIAIVLIVNLYYPKLTQHINLQYQFTHQEIDLYQNQGKQIFIQLTTK